MERWHHSTWTWIWLILMVSGGPLLAAEAWAGRSSLEAGLRAGASFNEEDESFNQYDMFVRYGLPWSWVWGEALQVDTNVAASMGVLEGGDDAGIVGTLGFEFVFGSARGKCPFEVRAGSALTLISEDQYGDEDLGGPVQFTHHISLHYWFLENLSAVARVQHMSNAGLYDENPGLDMIMIGLLCRF
jgi:lipid A 3-O-deacylase